MNWQREKPPAAASGARATGKRLLVRGLARPKMSFIALVPALAPSGQRRTAAASWLSGAHDAKPAVGASQPLAGEAVQFQPPLAYILVVVGE